MEIVLLALAAALVAKATDFVRYAKAGDLSAVASQVVAWGVGIGVAFLLVHQNLTAHIAVHGVAIASANGAATVLLGLGLGSGGSITADVIKALDTENATTSPRL